MLDFLVTLMFVIGCATTIACVIGFAIWFLIWRGTNR